MSWGDFITPARNLKAEPAKTIIPTAIDTRLIKSNRIMCPISRWSVATRRGDDDETEPSRSAAFGPAFPCPGPVYFLSRGRPPIKAHAWPSTGPQNNTAGLRSNTTGLSSPFKWIPPPPPQENKTASLLTRRRQCFCSITDCRVCPRQSVFASAMDLSSSARQVGVHLEITSYTWSDWPTLR